MFKGDEAAQLDRRREAAEQMRERILAASIREIHVTQGMTDTVHLRESTALGIIRRIGFVTITDPHIKQNKNEIKAVFERQCAVNKKPIAQQQAWQQHLIVYSSTCADGKVHRWNTSTNGMYIRRTGAPNGSQVLDLLEDVQHGMDLANKEMKYDWHSMMACRSRGCKNHTQGRCVVPGVMAFDLDPNDTPLFPTKECFSIVNPFFSKAMGPRAFWMHNTWEASYKERCSVSSYNRSYPVISQKALVSNSFVVKALRSIFCYMIDITNQDIFGGQRSSIKASNVTSIGEIDDKDPTKNELWASKDGFDVSLSQFSEIQRISREKALEDIRYCNIFGSFSSWRARQRKECPCNEDIVSDQKKAVPIQKSRKHCTIESRG